MAISKAQMRAMRRRKTSNIDRLAQQYQKDISALTGDYEKSFMGTQAEREKQMQPYAAASEQYKTAMADFETQAAAYRGSLDEYQGKIKAFEKDPFERITVPTAKYNFRAGSYDLNIPGRGVVNFNNLPDYEIESIGREVKINKGRTPDMAYDIVLKREAKTPDPFTEKAPTAPKAPEMPELAGFDEQKFQTRRGELDTVFKREVGERKAARLGAVSRRTARPMLQGA